MTSRFAQPAAKKTVASKTKRITPTTKVELPEPPAATPDEEVQSAWRQVEEALSGLMAKIKRPSWVRELVNVSIGLITYAAAFYGCMQLVDLVCMAAITYTGVGFISFMVAFLGVFAAFMAAFSLGKFAYNVAAAFEYKAVKSRVASMFSFNRAATA
jgi:hypothetical protein